jgi:large subunit ribosomal protein L2
MRDPKKKINKKFEFIRNAKPHLRNFVYRLHKKYSGRNRNGQMVLRHRGGGLRFKFTSLDIYRKTVGQDFCVICIKYDPRRKTRIATVVSKESGLMFNIVCPIGLKVGSIIWSREKLGDYDRYFTYKTKIISRVGCSMPLGSIANGLEVHMVESFPCSGSKLIRSPGTFARVIKRKVFKGVEYVCLKLPSGEEKFVPANCFATLGRISGADNKRCSMQKAGRNRLLGWRPRVRGVAMNPVDHPHGGGEGKSSGGRLSVSKWGKLTKGYKTMTQKRHRRKQKLHDRIAHQLVKKRSEEFY